MRIVTLASGSSGNSALISSGETHILLDAGISMKRIASAVAALGLRPEDISGVLITHEHSDHINGLAMLLKHYPLPVYAPAALGRALCYRIAAMEDHLRTIVPGEPFSLGDITVRAFPTPHDVRESVGYVFETDVRFGFCTDTGSITDSMRQALTGCRGVLIEANHDIDMLRAGPYPYPLQQRILSPRGHLSNVDCAALAVELASSGTASITLGHLSRENNTPALAERTVRSALDEAGFAGTELRVAPPFESLCWEVTPC